jgi:anti-anti-sigma factor
MVASGYSFQMARGVPVVTTPAEIDISTAGELRAVLLQSHARGHTTLVVDLTGTVFCDLAGLRELERAHQRAGAAAGGLRLAVAAEGAFLRIFTASGLDGIIPHFATVQQALAQVPAAATRPRRQPHRTEPAGAPASPPARLHEHHGLAAESRRCEHCGAMFVPPREHARFCTSDCRAVWNGEHLGDPAADASALAWSIAAMSEATARLPAVKAWDQPQAFAAIGEAVWWITMVDATLVRHHLGTYDAVMAARPPASRELIMEVLGGLRFARNWISRGTGLDELIETSAGTRRITHWTWKPIPPPALAGLSSRAQAWELTRYRAYLARLAGHPIGETFGRAVTFLTLTGATAASSTNASQHDSRS